MVYGGIGIFTCKSVKNIALLLLVIIYIWSQCLTISVSSQRCKNLDFSTGSDIVNFNGDFEPINNNSMKILEARPGAPTEVTTDPVVIEGNSATISFFWEKDGDYPNFFNLSFFMDDKFVSECKNGKEAVPFYHKFENDGKINHTFKWILKHGGKECIGNSPTANALISGFILCGCRFESKKNSTPPQLTASFDVYNMSELKSYVEPSKNLNDSRLVLHKGPYVGDLNITANNFSLQPMNGQSVRFVNSISKFNIRLSNTSNVVISNLIFDDDASREIIKLDGCKNCSIIGNTFTTSTGNAIYLGNGSSNNTVSGNTVISHLINNNHSSIYIYKSNHNDISNNRIICDTNVHYYLADSLYNNLSIYYGKFFINGKYYRLDENLEFYEIGKDSDKDLGPGSKTIPRPIGDNNWECC